jgi:choice-of-anchor A domain-containing protein
MRGLRTALAITVLTASARAGNIVGPLGCSSCGFNASAFNVVTLGTGSTGLGANNAGNFSPNSDIGGGVAIYGSYTGNGYAINQQYSSVPNNSYTDAYTMIVNGSISTNGSFSVDGSGSQPVYVGGTYSSNDFNGTAPTVSKPPTTPQSDFNFLAARTSLEQLSDSTLANYSGATTMTPVLNGAQNYVVSTVGLGNGLFVYNVNASYFTGQNNAFEVDLSSGQSVVINVVGATSTLTFSKGTVIMYNGSQVTANTTGGVPVLFNLPEVTQLDTSNGAINGSILAPFAAFDSPNQDVDGQLVVASVSGLAETHDQYYSGTLPSMSQVATPEPGTLSLLFLGAVLVFAGIRRTRTEQK